MAELKEAVEDLKEDLREIEETRERGLASLEMNYREIIELIEGNEAKLLAYLLAHEGCGKRDIKELIEEMERLEENQFFREHI